MREDRKTMNWQLMTIRNRGVVILWYTPASHLQSTQCNGDQLKTPRNSRRRGVDGRCDGDWDECQRSEGGNKPPRQGRSWVVSLWKILWEPRAFTLSPRKRKDIVGESCPSESRTMVLDPTVSPFRRVSPTSVVVVLDALDWWWGFFHLSHNLT